MSTSSPDLQPLTKWGERTRRLKLECIEILGRYRDHEGNVQSDPRCKNPNCRWHNDDGTIGCNDPSALEFDHRDGGGSVERKLGRAGGDMTYYAIKRKPWLFQLLCANCHAIKSSKEKGGARLHKQPAIVRRSQQIEGHPVRRVRRQLSPLSTPR